MTKFNELSRDELEGIGNEINMIFIYYGIDKESVNAFWECVEIGNKKMESA